MRVRLLSLLVVCFALSTPTHARQSRSTATAFMHVNVVDVTTGQLLNDMTVVIDGKRIATVTPSSTARVPAQRVRLRVGLPDRDSRRVQGAIDGSPR